VLAVVKVRASTHSDELRLFEIDEDGIRIGTVLLSHEGLLGGKPRRRDPSDGPGAGTDHD
jgi:circadian clock protein KaiC